MKSIKHTMASQRDTRATISTAELMRQFPINLGQDITLYYGDYNIAINYHPSRQGTTYYAESPFPVNMPKPTVGMPIYFNVIPWDPGYKFKDTYLFRNEFQPIREWAQQRGLYDKGDLKTQVVKLQEEVGELSKAILQQDDPEINDAIGDCVIVLTNLARLNNTRIEKCINDAYEVIVDRKGKMINGTFIKQNG